jgi:hypothetical protein
MTGFWRRNVWGLIALVPVLVATLWLTLGDAYDIYWKRYPREPVVAGGDGWISYGGARIRLIGLAPAHNLKDYSGKPWTPPASSRAWRATISFQLADPKAKIGGCTLALEDSAGHTYHANPSELHGARTPYAGCTQDTLATPAPTFELAAYFVLPADAKAVALRVTLAAELPRYARLTDSG